MNASFAFASLRVARHGVVAAGAEEVRVSLTPTYVGLSIISVLIFLLLFYAFDTAPPGSARSWSGATDDVEDDDCRSGCRGWLPILLLWIPYAVHTGAPYLPYGPGGALHWAFVGAAIFAARFSGLPGGGDGSSGPFRTKALLFGANLACAASVLILSVQTSRQDCGFTIVGPLVAGLLMSLVVVRIGRWSSGERVAEELGTFFLVALIAAGSVVIHIMGFACLQIMTSTAEAWVLLGADLMLLWSLKDLIFLTRSPDW